MERCKDNAVTHVRACGIVLALGGALSALAVCLCYSEHGERVQK